MLESSKSRVPVCHILYITEDTQDNIHQSLKMYAGYLSWTHQGYEHVIANPSTTCCRVVKELKSFKFVIFAVQHLGILNIMCPLSIVFEKDILLPFDVVPAIRRTESSIVAVVFRWTMMKKMKLMMGHGRKKRKTMNM